MKSALSSKVAENDFVVVENMTAAGAKTKTVVSMLKALGADKKALIVTNEVDEKMVRATRRHLPGVKTTFTGSLERDRYSEQQQGGYRQGSRSDGRGGLRRMKSAYDIIKRPVLTEKSYAEMNDRKYTFEVAVDAGKTEIKHAVEELFEGVKVASVNTMRVQGKVKRQGRTMGRRPERKKAIVTLKADSKGIQFFEGMSEEA